jgi:hypothetical protein
MQPLPVLTSSHGNTLLELWERGLGQAGAARADLVLHASGGGAAPPRTLGERNVSLIELHARLFGPQLDLLSRCPSCGTAAQFSSDCGALAALRPDADPARPHRVEIQEYAIEFRLPDGTDLAEASREDAEDEFVRHLLERCVLACSLGRESVPVCDVPERVLDDLSQRMEALDPAARVAFAVECPQCGARWDAHLDVEQLVWTKVQAAAERLLLEIDTLARAYGWTEREVLALSPLPPPALADETG